MTDEEAAGRIQHFAKQLTPFTVMTTAEECRRQCAASLLRGNWLLRMAWGDEEAERRYDIGPLPLPEVWTA